MSYTPSDKDLGFLDGSSRTRILAYIQHLCSTSKYLEPFFSVRDKRKSKTYLDANKVNQASNALLGYSIDTYFNIEDMKWSYYNIDDNYEELYYEDSKIFDLIELLIVFCKKEHRNRISEAFGDLFRNIGFPADLVSWMVILHDGNSLSALAPLVENQTLKSKLELTAIPGRVRDIENSARISADLTQLLYSSEEGKDKTKSYAEEVISRAADLWVTDANKENFEKLVSEIVNKVKQLNNQISNVRHTDKHTMIVNSPAVYKMIYSLNMGISELALVATQDELVSISDPEDIKNDYAKRFDIDMALGNEISNTTDDGIINLDDIPF